MTAEAADTRSKLIEAAIALMRRSGLSGAGINEIVKQSGAPKGSVYYFFPEGKRQIVSEALAEYGKRGVASWDEILSKPGKAGEKIHALFGAISERLTRAKYRQSCAAGAVCLDLEDEDLEAVRAVIENVFTEWIAVVGRHFPIRDPDRRRSFAGLVLTVVEGAFIRARASNSAQPFREAADWLAHFVEREMRTFPKRRLRRKYP